MIFISAEPAMAQFYLPPTRLIHNWNEPYLQCLCFPATNHHVHIHHSEDMRLSKYGWLVIYLDSVPIPWTATFLSTNRVWCRVTMFVFLMLYWYFFLLFTELILFSVHRRFITLWMRITTAFFGCVLSVPMCSSCSGTSWTCGCS